MPSPQDFCFCTLALGEKYQRLAQDLGNDLSTFAPDTRLVIFTDNPNFFRHSPNVLAFFHRQQGILHCYNDKRLAIAKALSLFSVALCIDADARIIAPMPPNLNWIPGVHAYSEPLIPHVSKFTPERLPHLQTVAGKVEVSLEACQWVGEALFAVTRDNGKETAFLEHWGRIGRYLELRGVHAGEGNAIGIAAAKVGWQVMKSDAWQEVNQLWQHFDASANKTPRSRWQTLQRRLGYHYRLNRDRLLALSDFDFYYR